MTATRDFLMIAAASGANVDSQTNYAGSGYQTNGLQPGITLSAQVNKGLRQGTAAMAVLAQFIVNVLNQNVLDTGYANEAAEVAALVAQFEAALAAYVVGSSIKAITALTGDVTATGGGSAAATLATVNAAPGTYTGPVTVNGKGLVTAASNVPFTGTSGYQKLPSGLLLQWGSLARTGEETAGSFPVTFPTACFGGVVTYTASSTENTRCISFNVVNTSSFSIHCDADTPPTPTMFWLAIGY